MRTTRFEVGDHIKRNADLWVPNDFDSWGRGQGIGQIIEPPFELDPDVVDVRWPNGRCFEKVDQLLPATEADTLKSGNISDSS